MTNETAEMRAEPEWTFEAALERLNEIAGRLEGDGMELDESLALFEEGVRLLRFAEAVLSGADARVRQLLEDAGGGFRFGDSPRPRDGDGVRRGAGRRRAPRRRARPGERRARRRRRQAVEGAPAALRDPMRYALATPGKRIRPVLCVSAWRAFRPGAAPDAVYRLAAAVEIVHTYSLVHDDLPCMDDDPLRRGRPTVHTVYGSARAMLAGAALIPAAVRVLDHAGRGAPPGSGHPRHAGGGALPRRRRRGDGGRPAAGPGGRGSSAGRRPAGAHPPAEDRRAARFVAAPGRARRRRPRRGAGGRLPLRRAAGPRLPDRGRRARRGGRRGSLGKTAGKDESAGKTTYPALFGVDGAQALAASEVAAATPRSATAASAPPSWRRSPATSSTAPTDVHPGPISASRATSETPSRQSPPNRRLAGFSGFDRGLMRPWTCITVRVLHPILHPVRGCRTGALPSIHPRATCLMRTEAWRSTAVSRRRLNRLASPRVLGWWPLLWTIRAALLIVVLTGSSVFLLLIARFFRWKHVKEMFTADLPVVRTVGGKLLVWKPRHSSPQPTKRRARSWK